MLLRPEHANPTPPISTLHQIPTSPSLSASSPSPSETYALTFSCIAGFDVIVLNSKFWVGGLVLEGSVVQPSSSPEMEFEGSGWGSRRWIGFQMRETVAMTDAGENQRFSRRRGIDNLGITQPGATEFAHIANRGFAHTTKPNA